MRMRKEPEPKFFDYVRMTHLNNHITSPVIRQTHTLKGF